MKDLVPAPRRWKAVTLPVSLTVSLVWLDREYAVTLVAKDHAGHVVGAMQSGYLAAVPARSSMVSRWHTITLTVPGAITCHVGQAKMVTA